MEKKRKISQERNIEREENSLRRKSKATVNWKKHMEKIMNVENEWDQMVEADMVEGPVEKVTDKEVVEATNIMKLREAAGPSEVNMDRVIARGKFGVGVIIKLCQRVLDGKGMPEEWKTSVVGPSFKGKGDVMGCGAYKGVKLLKHAMKVVERVLEDSTRVLVTIDDMQFGFMPTKGTTHALFILKRMQEEFREREQKLYMCFVDLEKAFDRVPRKGMGIKKERIGRSVGASSAEFIRGFNDERKLELDQGHRKNFGYGLVIIKGLCYHL